MTHRERMERRAEKRDAWAEGRRRKSDADANRAQQISERFWMGQPILIGHHSEKKSRRDQQRMWDATERSLDHARAAEHHDQAASGIRSQLDRAIYDDDPDAIERLEERIAAQEQERDRAKAINKEMRRGDGWSERLDPPLTDDEREQIRNWARVGQRGISVTNLTADIRRNRERLARLRQASDDGRPLRCIQARRDGECDRCGESIQRGDWIGKYPDGWSHITARGDAWQRCARDG